MIMALLIFTVIAFGYQIVQDRIAIHHMQDRMEAYVNDVNRYKVIDQQQNEDSKQINN